MVADAGHARPGEIAAVAGIVIIAPPLPIASGSYLALSGEGS
jgi:hypothetical protein